MFSIVVFSQNLKLNSLLSVLAKLNAKEPFVFVTTHFLFENEKSLIKTAYPKSIFHTFADFLTDREMEMCDKKAYYKGIEYNKYIKRIKVFKNRLVIKKITNFYKPKNKFILSDDLGIDLECWQRHGFRKINGEYYYCEKKEKKTAFHTIRSCLSKNKLLKKIYSFFVRKKKVPLYNPEEVNVCFFNDKKYVFIGNKSRIEYRLNVAFSTSKEDFYNLTNGIYETSDKCVYMTTWHERWKCAIPDKKKYDVRWAQDGYLPPNYSHKDYFFKPKNVVYYCWDYLGTLLFKNNGLPYEMIPFRKKIFLPKPFFPKKVKNVLIVASGSGDWTALKNRSDDDLLVDAFVRMAKVFPDVHFVYRCHPTWVHPKNVGVNSIHRVSQCFEELGLGNIVVSSNIPSAESNGAFKFSFSRTSLDEDLAKADFVFGEHSISMIDAALKGIPFASINLTNRRDFFEGITRLGFPSCSSLTEIEFVIRNVSDHLFQKNILNAIDNYNRMTDADDCSDLLDICQK